MNLITAIIIGFFVLLAYCMLYYLVTSNNINDMKRTMWADIKTLDLEDVFDFLVVWLVCSAVLWAVVNVCGLLISIFIAADINFFQLVLDGMSYDPLVHINLTALS